MQYDIAVIGGGPAGYSAGLYAARAGLSCAVIERGMPGGQIATSDVIDNYPGIPTLSGAELGMKMQEHAESAGCETIYQDIETIARNEDGTFHLVYGDNHIQAASVIAATGASPRPAGFAGEDTYRGRGISYCATCDGMFYRGKRVYVVGGGNAAVEEALFLSRIASEVILVVRRDQFRAPTGMVGKLEKVENISIRYLTSIVEVSGENLLTTITFKDNASGETYTEHHDAGTFGIFVFVGNDPITELVQGYVDLGQDGGVLTDEFMATKTPGLFCAGDMRTKALRQVITAAADGAVAATSAYRYLESRGQSA